MSLITITTIKVEKQTQYMFLLQKVKKHKSHGQMLKSIFEFNSVKYFKKNLFEKLTLFAFFFYNSFEWEHQQIALANMLMQDLHYLSRI
jgi:hypothetical protein